MPTILNWPESGEWHLSQAKSPIGHNSSGFYFKDEPPFAVLTVDFRSKTGTIRKYQTTARINNINLIQSAEGPKFTGSYAIGAHSGRYEAIVFDEYVLEIRFTGTTETSVNARPSTIIGGDRDVRSKSTPDKLQEAIRRALPMMPGEVQREVVALFTPASIAVIAGLAGLWVASHAAVVGWVADFALAATLFVLIGKIAIDIGNHLAGFMVKACGATTEEDLDEAARHFAAAVLLGGPLLVAKLLKSSRPVRRELPKREDIVPASRVPLSSRMRVAAQGDRPRFSGLADDVQQALRNRLDQLRQQSLRNPREVDCTQACMDLDKLSGRRGHVGEYSGNADWAGIADHRMWRIGDEIVCAVPGWWKQLFTARPQLRDQLNKVLPGLAERLEKGAVLNFVEYGLYHLGRQPPPGWVPPIGPVAGA